jgi:hypothetical protein
MKEYAEVYDLLGLPDAIRRCALGEIQLPSYIWSAPTYQPGYFPPALIPIWDQVPHYCGYWKHWFGGRAGSYVELSMEGLYAVEVARTAQQLFCKMMVFEAEAFGISDEIREFAKQTKMSSLDEVDKFVREVGDDPVQFRRLSEFRNDLPAESVSDPQEYNGEFPILGSPKLYDPTQEYCWFEYPEGTLNKWPTDVARPIWLTDGPKPKHFENALRKGRLKEAWLILHSTGWTLPEVHEAVADLAKAAKDEAFLVLAKAWSSVADKVNGGY